MPCCSSAVFYTYNYTHFIQGVTVRIRIFPRQLHEKITVRRLLLEDTLIAGICVHFAYAKRA